MTATIKKLIEENIDLIDQSKFKELLYILFRSKVSNVNVYLVMSALNKARVASLQHLKVIAAELFISAVDTALVDNSLRVYPNLRTALYGDRAVKPIIPNCFGFDYIECVQILQDNASRLQIELRPIPEQSDEYQLIYLPVKV